MAGLVTESIMEKLQRSLLSSDPRMSSIRLGMIEKLGPLTGKRQIAPTMGEVMGAGAAGIRQGEKDYLQDEFTKWKMRDTFSYKERKIPYVTDDGEQREKLEVSYQGGKPGTWVEKSDYLRYKKSEPTGGLTTSQIRTNKEIDNARGQLDEAFVKWQNEKPEERKDKILGDWVYETSVKLDEMTSLPVPDYNTFAMKAANKAMQSKYGDDLEFSEIYTSIFEGSPQATSLWDATQKTPDKNEDSIWSKVGKLFTGDDKEEVKEEVTFTVTDDKYKSMSVKEIIEETKKSNPNLKEEEIVEELIKRKIIQRK